MKKDNLLLLYSKLNDLSIKITANLKVLKDLSSDIEEEYISFCIKHNDVIDEEVFAKTLQLFDNIAYLIPYERKQEILLLLDELFDNDYVTSSEDFTDILESLITIINIPIGNIIDLSTLYECDEYASADDFIIEILKGYLNQFKSLKDLSYDKIYSQEISKINKSYFSMLEDLNNTYYNKEEGLYMGYINRVNSYLKVIRDPEVYSMMPKKYEAVLSCASYIRSSKELTNFLRRIKLLDKNITGNEFSRKIEEYTDEVSENTIELIYKNLGIKRDKELSDEYNEVFDIPNELTEEGTYSTVNKVLSKKNSKNIVLF